MLTNWEDIYRKVYKDYLHEDVELCGAFFNFEVSAPKSDLLKAYAELQDTINGDTIIRLRDATEIPDTRDRGATTHVAGWEYEGEDEYMSEVFTGNMRDFLESFNGQEHKTGWYRLSDCSDCYMGYASMTGGIKQCFVL